MFLPQTSRLLGALTEPQLTAHLQAALLLAPSSPAWLKARWRSYLSHLRLSLIVELEELECEREYELEVLLRLCELLCAITPLELQPSEERVALWLEDRLEGTISREPLSEVSRDALSEQRSTHRAVVSQELREEIKELEEIKASPV